MKLKSLIAQVLVLVGLFTGTADAWGRQGHEIIASIAQERLSPKAKEFINALRTAKLDLVGVHPNERVASFRYIDTNLSLFCDKRQPLDLRLIANWADGWRFREKSTAPWHFVNLPIDRTITEKDEAAYCPNSDCVVDQISLQLAVLRDTTRRPEDRLKALFFVVHFVGDIHQPLHCADDHDRGGNDKKARFASGLTNLHHIWDDSILQAQHKNVAQMAAQADQSFSENDAKAWESTQPEAWALESREIAVDVIYPKYPKDGSIPSYGQPYVDAMEPVVMKQLARAGLRLAGVINTIVKK